MFVFALISYYPAKHLNRNLTTHPQVYQLLGPVRIDGAMPFTTTPNHRIMVPGMTPTTVKAAHVVVDVE